MDIPPPAMTGSRLVFCLFIFNVFIVTITKYIFKIASEHIIIIINLISTSTVHIWIEQDYLSVCPVTVSCPDQSISFVPDVMIKQCGITIWLWFLPHWSFYLNWNVSSPHTSIHWLDWLILVIESLFSVHPLSTLSLTDANPLHQLSWSSNVAWTSGLCFSFIGLSLQLPQTNASLPYQVSQ